MGGFVLSQALADAVLSGGWKTCAWQLAFGPPGVTESLSQWSPDDVGFAFERAAGMFPLGFWRCNSPLWA